MDYLSLYTGKEVHIQGYNGVLAVTAEFVNSNSIVFSAAGTTNLNLSAGAGVNCMVAAASANDKGVATAGTGLRTLVVIGAEGTTGNVISETITTNGQTGVVTVNKYQAHYCMYGTSWGTGLTNAGNIDIALKADPTNTAGVLTAPTPSMRMLAGENVSQNAIFIVPTGKTYETDRIIFGAAVQPCIALVWIMDGVSKAWTLLARVPVGNIAGGAEIPLKGCTLAAGDAIRVDALSTTAAGQIWVDVVLKRVMR